MIKPTVASQGEMTMLIQMTPSAEAIGQGDCKASRTIGVRTFVTCASFTHAATLSRASDSGSEDFEDDTRHRQDVAKGIENEIAVADCRGRVLAVIDHLPRTFNFALACAYATRLLCRGFP